MAILSEMIKHNMVQISMSSDLNHWFGTSADLPLIQILSVYTDFLTVKFGKIQIFLPKIRWNTDFVLECQRFFLILSLFIQIFFLKYWFFWSFILILCEIIVAGLHQATISYLNIYYTWLNYLLNISIIFSNMFEVVWIFMYILIYLPEYLQNCITFILISTFVIFYFSFYCFHLS